MKLNYGRVKIYKITNEIDDKFYIGSTTKKHLSDRMWLHASSSMDLKVSNYKCHLYQHFRRLGQFNFSIELLEDFPCNSRGEMVSREQEWMDYHLYTWDRALNQRRAMK